LTIAFPSVSLPSDRVAATFRGVRKERFLDHHDDSRALPMPRSNTIDKRLTSAREVRRKRVVSALISRRERISSATNAVVFCEILLAALLNMCNAPENFYLLSRKSCERCRIHQVKRIFSYSTH
jgi:hypothetical protein